MSDGYSVIYSYHVICLIAVSAKFVFNNDITVVSNPTGEYKEFVRAIGMLFEVVSQLTSGVLPLYKLYNNNLAKMYQESMTVSYSW